MNVLELLKSLEDLIFEVSTWVVLVPKTLLKVVRSPSWASTYVSMQAEQASDDVYDDYVSPVVLWLTCSVLPYLWFVLALDVNERQGLETQALLVSVFLASGPIGMATSFVLEKKQELTKKHLKYQFYVQCYIFSIFYMLLFPFLIRIMADFPEIKFDMPIEQYVIIASSFLLALIWLCVAEVVTIKKELDCSMLKSMLLLLPMVFTSYMIFFVVFAIMQIAILVLK